MRLRTLLTPLWLLFTAVVVAVAAGCLLLGWWQLSRLQDGGTAQNLGYTIQWPFFSAFAIYLWWKLLRDAAAGSSPDPDGSKSPAVRESAEPRRARPARPARPAEPAAVREAVDADDDRELAAYNRYLSGLNARTKESH